MKKMTRKILEGLPPSILIEGCMAKIHGATVTQADLNYAGSITIDPDLTDPIGMQPNQYVNITNCANGAFWRTYIMPGKRGSGVICLNGPPARHFQPGDKIMVLAQVQIKPLELSKLVQRVAFVDGKNRLVRIEKHFGKEHK